MTRAHDGHSTLHFYNRGAEPLRAENIMDRDVVQLVNVLKRNPSADSSTSNTCTKNDKSQQCGKPSDSNNITLPVVLGVLYGFRLPNRIEWITNQLSRIPLGAALIVFFFLHRRHLRRLRREDANDPHKSLDFGIDPSMQSSGKKKGKKNSPETAVIDLSTEKALRREHGMSMDMGNPYLLPPGLQSSRESLHSLSRNIHVRDDRYRPATTLIPNDSASIHSYPRQQRGDDDSSSHAGSGFSGRGHGTDGMNQNLLQNAQRMSKSLPLNPNILTTFGGDASESHTLETRAKQPTEPALLKGGQLGLSPAVSADTRASVVSNVGADIRRSNNYLGPLISETETSTNVRSQNPDQASAASPTTVPVSVPSQPARNRKSPPATISTTSNLVRPPRLQSLNASTEPKYHDESTNNLNNHSNSFNVTPPTPTKALHAQQNASASNGNLEKLPPTHGETSVGMDVPALGYDVRRLSMGFRPLPPEDPTDNPEQRANRIRSFYKEYFDETKTAPLHAPGDYVEDYDESYLGDAAIYDPANGQFVIAQPQFSEPVSRRAMTPPPRAPPRFQSPRPHQAAMSGSGFMPRGQRAFSTASGQRGPPGRGPKRPALPPPGPLRVLPSPHLVKEDSFALPIDFAPPMTYKDRRVGRPESPRGGMRPYSPMLPAHLPLASSFDDLSVMPSP